MAGAKKQPRRKKRAPSAASPTSSSIRSVSRSSAPTTRELATRLGIHPSTVRRRALAGTLRAVIDRSGRYHFPSRAAPSSRPVKRPPFRKKKAKSTSRPPPPRAPAPRKNRPSPRSPAPIRSGIRQVAESSSPSLPQAAADVFRVSPERLQKLVTQGAVRAVRDARGTLHIPAAALQAKQLALKRARKKRKAEGRAPRAPWETIDSGPRRKKKKRPSSRAEKKKKKAGKLAKKKKRVRKTKPSRQRFTEAIADDTRPSRFAEDRPTPAVVSRDAPMQLELAAQRVGNAMRDFVMAKPRWERLGTGRVFHDLKTSFRSTYSERQWRLTYAWVVDEWGLEDYIFDYEALRDS